MSFLGPDFETNRKRSIDQARKCPKGMTVEHLVPGAIVTYGPSKHTGDRSGIESIWKVLGTNGGHIALECVLGDYCRKGGDRALVVISEREWYPAEHMLEVLNSDHDKKKD